MVSLKVLNYSSSVTNVEFRWMVGLRVLRYLWSELLRSLLLPREGRICGCFQRVRFASGSSSSDLAVGLWPPKEITSPSPQAVLLHRFQGRGLGNHTTGRKTIKRRGLHVLSLLGVLKPHSLRNQPSRAVWHSITVTVPFHPSQGAVWL